jgi:hypothetical protein
MAGTGSKDTYHGTSFNTNAEPKSAASPAGGPAQNFDKHGFSTTHPHEGPGGSADVRHGTNPGLKGGVTGPGEPTNPGSHQPTSLEKHNEGGSDGSSHGPMNIGHSSSRPEDSPAGSSLKRR